jgi:hypothetical protein
VVIKTSKPVEVSAQMISQIGSAFFTEIEYPAIDDLMYLSGVKK